MPPPVWRVCLVLLAELCASSISSVFFAQFFGSLCFSFLDNTARCTFPYMHFAPLEANVDQKFNIWRLCLVLFWRASFHVHSPCIGSTFSLLVNHKKCSCCTPLDFLSTTDTLISHKIAASISCGNQNSLQNSWNSVSIHLLNHKCHRDNLAYIYWIHWCTVIRFSVR